ncbi:MAG: bifunctional diaminohydroxyphosphoribosylaminopyrimidine deaminase/5-amino-6-(5-phosphoribosylamino)uracil reductase RibD, partial [Sphingobacteriales bacterium]
PNPMVGAILVYNDRIIGEGWHRAFGQPHAEVACLENVASEHRHLIPESTMYVSLEPCAHFGKTPPCADRIVAEGIKRVIVCNRDPFDKVSGKGFDILKDHGIETEAGLSEQAGRWLNRRFFCFHEQKRPYIILKWAQTSGGFFAPLNRTRFQMSNVHSQQLLHKWRTEEAAIMVGTRTALHDDPALTARLWKGRQPLRIVLDRRLELPGNLRVFNSDAPTWIINESKESAHGLVTYRKLPFDNQLLQSLCSLMHAESKTSLLVEGGATLLNHFIEAGLWDEARIFMTTASLADGIHAPLLKNAAPAFSSILGFDELLVSTNMNSAFAWQPGMQL